ncbi:MAG TPA: HD domain-containing phosphohydrolase [Blastocatellia bacterium]|nr:HD domain-containing phosphohydrolase [Blastocatellia bacterium]
MISIDRIKSGFKHHGAKGTALLICLTLVASALLAISIYEVATSPYQSILIWALLALVIALTSARHPIAFPGTNTSVSVSEALMFLGVIALGPYHGVLLGAVEMIVVSRQLRLKMSLWLFNISNVTISFFIAGKIYYALSAYLATHEFATGAGQTLVAFALPLVALAFTHYSLHIVVLMLMSFVRGRQVAGVARDTLPWEPVTYLACATVAGMVNYAFSNKGLIITLAIMLLVLPIPVIIYYTFKTYHDKLGEQEHHYQELTNIYDSILEMLAMAIDAKDDVTHDHIQRVKLFARRMGEIVGLSELEIEALKAGALLHDIGKIGVPAYILNKPGKLTEHEFEQMKMHTIIGADMLSNVDFRYPVVPIVRHHHERWDGRGYPDGLAGEKIPITARILTLVDNYDALRSDRPYKTGMTKQEALDYIKQNAGTFFDPKLVEIFLSIVDQLEEEAAAACLKEPVRNKRTRAESLALSKAKPAAGFDAAPPVNRAAAALNSIAETNQRVTALYEMSRTLSSILPLEDTVAILANRLSKLLPFTTCAISLFDATRSEFEIVYAVGLNADKFMKRRLPAEAGITGYVITNQRAMYNTNPVLDLGFLGVDEANKYKGVIVFPLVKNQESLGAIALYSTEVTAYGVEHIQLMESVSQPAADAIHNAIAFEQAQRAAFTDYVTGVASKHALTTQFERELTRCQRLGSPLSLVVVNLNDIKQSVATSDSTTEQLLTQVGRIIKIQVRETDLVARYSHGTFVALLPDTGQAEATEVRSRIREAMNKAVGFSLSVSLGSATSPVAGTSFKELFQAAQVDCAASRESLDLASATMADALATKRVS